MEQAAAQKILLVDSNPRALKLLEFRISQQGYQVFTAERGKDAVVTAIIVKPDLVVSEFQLPDLQVAEFKKILSSIPATASAPLLFLSSDAESQPPTLEGSGATVDYLQKPYAFEELLGRIRVLLQERKETEIFPEQPERSDATFQEMTVLDIMQVLSMNKKTCTMTLKQGDRTGRIYFREGKIVDAATPHLSGEEALYDLITWRGVNYAIGYESGNSEQETIHTDTRFLIGECFRRLEGMAESPPPLQSSTPFSMSAEESAPILEGERGGEEMDLLQNLVRQGLLIRTVEE